MRIVIAVDAVLLREGAARLFEDAGHEVVAQAGDADDLLRKVRAHRPDVAIIDVRMPPDNSDDGLRAALAIRNELPEVGILLLSQYVEDRYLGRLLGGGAEGVGYLLKDRVAEVERLAEAVERVAAGGSVLDPEVLVQMLGRARDKGPLDALTERERVAIDERRARIGLAAGMASYLLKIS
jgi:DNA-binding NarL/FixJ family response regulator